jgi:hypothetical protein
MRRTAVQSSGREENLFVASRPGIDQLKVALSVMETGMLYGRPVSWRPTIDAIDSSAIGLEPSRPPDSLDDWAMRGWITTAGHEHRKLTHFPALQ